jgi:hypothetical protein
MTPKKKHDEHIHCANPDCTRKSAMLAVQYRFDSTGVDPSRIHHVWWSQPPTGSFICSTCGHVTYRHAEANPASKQ